MSSSMCDSSEGATSVEPGFSSSSCSSNFGLDGLPMRVFATDQYPRRGRVNSYCKMQYLIDIVDLLSGKPEFTTVLNSQFGGLFRLPVNRCSLSGKLVHNLLCRQIVSENNNDAWFTFGGHPLRFSIMEFECVTGLLCSPYSSGSSIPLVIEEPYWNTLVGDVDSATIDDILHILKTEPDMPSWRRLRLVLIVIVEGVLLCGTHPVSASSGIVEMVRDVGTFLRYPWGRESFLLTLRMIKVGPRVKSTSRLVNKLKQPTLVVHGFPIALQLFMFECIPLLLRYLPSPSRNDTFLDRSVPYLRALKSFHTSNILLVENEPQLKVVPICRPVGCRLPVQYPSDAPVDAAIIFLEYLISGGYVFCKSDWQGGDVSLPLLCTCLPKDHGICSCPSKLKSDSVLPAASHTRSVPGIRSCSRRTIRSVTSKIKSGNTNSTANVRTRVCNEVGAKPATRTPLKPKERRFKSRVSKVSTPSLQPFSDSLSLDTSGNGHFRVSTSAPVPVDGSDSKRKRLSAPALTGQLNRRAIRTRLQSRNQEVRANDKCVFEISDSTPPVPCALSSANPKKRTSRHGSVRCSGEVCKPIDILNTELSVPEVSLEADGSSVAAVDQKLKQPALCIPGLPISSSNTVYCPFPVTAPDIVKKFKSILANRSTSGYTLDGFEVRAEFFAEIASPQHWLSNLHINYMIRPFWRSNSSYLLHNHMSVVDCYFTSYLTSYFRDFKACDPHTFKWPSMLRHYVLGHVPDRADITPWLRDVHTIYAPMNWGLRHWVALCINLRTWHVDIYDPLLTATSARKVPGLIAPVVEMLPYLLKAVCPADLTERLPYRPLRFTRWTELSQNDRTGDCGALSMKFIDLNSHSHPLIGITDEMVNSIRTEYAISVYTQFVGPIM